MPRHGPEFDWLAELIDREPHPLRRTSPVVSGEDEPVVNRVIALIHPPQCKRIKFAAQASRQEVVESIITKLTSFYELFQQNMRDFLKAQASEKPLGYEVPPFPSLYWLFPVGGSQCVYLYDTESIWRFTLYWTLIWVGGVHMVAAAYACAMQHRNWKLIWIVPIVYAIIGTTEAAIAGNVVGGLLGGIYSAGYFRMSTWIPLSWGIICALVLILSSFAIQGGL